MLNNYYIPFYGSTGSPAFCSAGKDVRATGYRFYITNSYFTALHGYASVSLAAAAGETPAYPLLAAKLHFFP